MLHVDADSHQSFLELTFLLVGQHVLGIEDGRSLVRRQSLLGILLQVLQREDVLNILIEIEVADLDGIFGVSVEVLEQLILFSRQLNLLGIKRRPELGGIDSALSEGIMILHEFSKTRSVPHHSILHLLEQLVDLLRAREVNVPVHVGRLGATEWLINGVLEHKGVVDEGQVLNVALLVAVDVDKGLQLLLGQLAFQQMAGLTELLRRNLEMVVPILILEEASRVKALSLDEGLESLLESSAKGMIMSGGINLAVE